MKYSSKEEDPTSPTSGVFSSLSIFRLAVSVFLLSFEALGGRSLWAQKEPKGWDTKTDTSSFLPDPFLLLGKDYRLKGGRGKGQEEEAGEEGMKKGRGVGIVPRVGGEFLRVGFRILCSTF